MLHTSCQVKVYTGAFSMNEESRWQKKEEEKDKPRIPSVKPVSQSMQYREREQLLMFSNAQYHA